MYKEDEYSESFISIDVCILLYHRLATVSNDSYNKNDEKTALKKLVIFSRFSPFFLFYFLLGWQQLEMKFLNGNNCIYEAILVS